MTANTRAMNRSDPWKPLPIGNQQFALLAIAVFLVAAPCQSATLDSRFNFAVVKTGTVTLLSLISGEESGPIDEIKFRTRDWVGGGSGTSRLLGILGPKKPGRSVGWNIAGKKRALFRGF